MSTLAIRVSHAHFLLPRDVMWNDRRSPGMSSGQRPQSERVELPSIRQAIPELDLRSIPGEGASIDRGDSTLYSPNPAIIRSEASTYPASSAVAKRRRTAIEADGAIVEVQDPLVPRHLLTSPRPSQYPQSVPLSRSQRQPTGYSSSAEISGEGSPYSAARPLPGIRSPSVFEPSARPDFRPTLPSLPSLTLERRGSGNVAQRSGSLSWSEYALDGSRPSSQIYPQQAGPPAFTNPPTPQSNYGLPSLQYGYQHPHNPSYPGPAGTSPHHQRIERSPFSTSPYQQSHREGHIYNSGMGGMHDGSKQRKRRGNLPKETTDKLRAWFVAHLQHPYPTEDEKQELMRQTGLQMNQISNWFINARRRQLPSMINNARAESDARCAEMGDGVLSGAEIDYDEARQSESEGGFEDEYESIGKGREAGRLRGASKGDKT
ncbi:MAG: hypothetical protein M1818_007891 [Claussenomyces sp. TS43310]|nr:MAG: hypothetical protein M1818_007891 [Claussenomyces sp. TS43310]